MPKIYDCFCYFNEDMLLELRLEMLWDYVDYFVISEAVYSQVGRPKQLNFNPEKFAKYREKIRYLVVDHLPPGEPGFWKNENYQRNFLINGLYDAGPDDLIIVSDLDEIPRAESIRQFDPKRYLRGDLHQYCYAYFLNNRLLDGMGFADWVGTKITTFGNLMGFFGDVNAVRSYKSAGMLRSFKRTWFRNFRVQHIENGGWHFSWVMEPARILLKMESIAEQQFVKDEFKNLQFIESRIRTGRDVLDRPLRYQPQKIDEIQFPLILVKDREKYADWLLAV
jgi:beta-1,4-mannosyl-glycoprotein beta-1,4-N-acetylglucosaminyltransferase